MVAGVVLAVIAQTTHRLGQLQRPKFLGGLVVGLLLSLLLPQPLEPLTRLQSVLAVLRDQAHQEMVAADQARYSAQ
jgi:hypothetical protein